MAGRRRSSLDVASAENTVRRKYMTGDLGVNVSADLNYTLKRLVRGLYSENHSVK